MKRIKTDFWRVLALLLCTFGTITCNDEEDPSSADEPDEENTTSQNGSDNDSTPSDNGDTTGSDTGDGVGDNASEGTGNEADTIAQGRPAALRGACETINEYGSFNLTYNADLSSIDGTVRNDFTGIVTEDVSVSGNCRLVRKRVAFCDPSCSAGQICDETGACVPDPTNQNVGTITLHGASEPIVLTPKSDANLYFNTALSVPPFTAGAELALEADGGDYAPFILYGTGIDPITSTDQEWVVSRGQPIQATWTAGTVSDATVAITLNVDQHGATPATLLCEVPDTGSMTLTADLIDDLLDLGITGHPSATIERHTIDSVETDLSCISFTVRSYVNIPVSMGAV